MQDSGYLIACNDLRQMSLEDTDLTPSLVVGVRIE